MSAAEAQKLSQRTVDTIVSLQEEAYFNKFWDDTLSKADNPKLPRKRKAHKELRNASNVMQTLSFFQIFQATIGKCIMKHLSL